MQRWKNSLFNITFALNCLLLFLLLFENRLSIPVWLQVAGRMHPLILHFPVVLVILYALTTLIFVFKKESKDNSYQNTTAVLLLLAALSSVVTALAGLFLLRVVSVPGEEINPGQQPCYPRVCRFYHPLIIKPLTPLPIRLLPFSHYGRIHIFFPISVLPYEQTQPLLPEKQQVAFFPASSVPVKWDGI